ncbi:MAG: hypothetical protein HYY13_06260 [Nitrospirae bacterium]|nr:hypothetical protein [Nitrospirota bacterium]
MSALLPGPARERLSSILHSGAHPPALLFVGPDGCGKREAARWFTRALNCHRTTSRSPSEPCSAEEAPCPACLQITAGTFPDLVTIQPEEDHPDHLTIDQVRGAIQGARLSLLTGRHKVIILARAASILLRAANALLKTLEEPPERATFILLADSHRGLPATVLSRCWIVPFAPWPESRLREDPRLGGLEPDDLRRVLSYSHGRPEKAARYARAFKAGKAKDFLREFWNAIREGGGPALQFAAKYEKPKEEFPERLQLLTDAFNAALAKSLSEKSPYSPAQWLCLTETALRAVKTLDVNANRKLLLERLIYEAREAIKPS